MSNNNNVSEEWPDFEPVDTFDWSLSMDQIEKKYTPKVLIKQKAPEIITDATPVLQYFRTLSKKYQYLFSLIPPEVSEWIFRNPTI